MTRAKRRLEQIVRNLHWHDRIVMIIRMRRDDRAHPRGRRLELSRCAPAYKVEVYSHLFECLSIAVDGLEVGEDERDQPGVIIALPAEDLEGAVERIHSADICGKRGAT